MNHFRSGQFVVVSFVAFAAFLMVHADVSHLANNGGGAPGNAGGKCANL